MTVVVLKRKRPRRINRVCMVWHLLFNVLWPILKYTSFRSEDISEIIPFLSVLYQQYEIQQKLLMGVN